MSKFFRSSITIKLSQLICHMLEEKKKKTTTMSQLLKNECNGTCEDAAENFMQHRMIVLVAQSQLCVCSQTCFRKIYTLLTHVNPWMSNQNAANSCCVRLGVVNVFVCREL